MSTTDDLIDALCECRDAFDVPPPGSTLEREWAAAMADPLAVPSYVKARIAERQSVPAGFDEWAKSQGYGPSMLRTHAQAGWNAATLAAPQPCIGGHDKACACVRWGIVSAPPPQPVRPLTTRELAELTGPWAHIWTASTATDGDAGRCAEHALQDAAQW